MKKLFLLAFCIFASMNIYAQSVKFGIKGGANFAKLQGDKVESEMITSFHAGLALEIKAPIIGLQIEALYSSQGSKVKGSDDIKLDYVSVPVLVKFYVVPSILSIEAGPQFSFLVKDNLDDTTKAKPFDFAAAGGLGVNITKSITLQGRYVAGLTETVKDSGTKNNIFQLSAVYYF